MTEDLTQNYYSEICFCGELEEVSFTAPLQFKKLNKGNSIIKEFAYGFTYVDGKINYTQTEIKNFQVNIQADVTHTGIVANREIKLRLSKNGSLTNIEGNIFSSGEILFKRIAATGEVSLSHDDFLEVMIANVSGNETIKVKDLKIVLVSK